MLRVAPGSHYFPRDLNWQSALVGVIVLGACIVGIMTRWLVDLASFWPVNAILLGILALRPETNRPMTWLAAALAYAFADFLAGTALPALLVLNAANLLGVATAVALFRQGPPDLFTQRNPRNTILVIAVLAVASGAAGIAGAIIGPALFNLSVGESLMLWFSSEFTNYAIVFPVMAALMAAEPELRHQFEGRRASAARQGQALVCLVLGLVAVHQFGGPGAIAFALPGLLWCSISFAPLPSTLITMAAITIVLVAGQNGHLPLDFHVDSVWDSSSFRLGLAMVALIPFTVVNLHAAWRTALSALLHSASHDALTGLRNRGAFMSDAEKALGAMSPNDDVCVMMIDIDKFKAINDAHGHAAGDAVICALAEVLRAGIRTEDVVGRIGGEEFAVLLRGSSPYGGQVTAERLRHAFGSLDIGVANKTVVQATISIGLTSHRGPVSLSDMLSAADAALYAAKRAGRNRVVSAGGEVAPAPQMIAR